MIGDGTAQGLARSVFGDAVQRLVADASADEEDKEATPPSPVGLRLRRHLRRPSSTSFSRWPSPGSSSTLVTATWCTSTFRCHGFAFGLFV
jgi:hypothetical protein